MPWTNNREARKEIQMFDARKNIAWYADWMFKASTQKIAKYVVNRTYHRMFWKYSNRNNGNFLDFV